MVALLLAGAASLPFFTSVDVDGNGYFLEATLTSDRNAITQVFFDVGHGYTEHDSYNQALKKSAQPSAYRFPLPFGIIRALRFDPTNMEGNLTIQNVQIVDVKGKIVRRFAPATVRPVQQISGWNIAKEILRIKIPANANDPITELEIGAPIDLRIHWQLKIVDVLVVWLIAAATALLSSALFHKIGGATGAVEIAARIRKHPFAALAVSAAFTVALQCHPVIFFGKSFVSPDNAGYLLYDRFPTLPGYATLGLEDGKGADVGAMLYQHLYYPVVEARAFFHDHEWPFWNRYALCGVPLLGQGQSMFGELLNWLPMLARSASWSWDVKFVVARWLYAFGMGVAVLLLVRRMTPAVILALASPFVGYFAYRINHPAQFSFCFSIWILVGWILIRDSRNLKSLAWAVLLLILANWEEVTSGTVKEAYMLLVFVNLGGALVLLLDKATPRSLAFKLCGALTGMVAVTLLTSPFWLIFLETLRSSKTGYDVPGVIQIQPALIIGLFEDLFYRQLKPGELHADPSANIIILFGLVWALVRFSDTFRQRSFVALGCVSLFAVAMIFGVMPEGPILHTPFIGNIHHIDNTFSCVLIVLGTAMSGFGLQAFRTRLGQPGWGIDCAMASLMLATPVALYFGANGAIEKSPFFCTYVPSLGFALIAGITGLALWAKRRAQGDLLAVSVAGMMLILLWRHGEYVKTPFDSYVFNPKVRADLHANSPAVRVLDELQATPARLTGFGYNLFCSYEEMLGWEGISGVDAVRSEHYDRLSIAGGAKKVIWWGEAGSFGETDLPSFHAIQDMYNVRYYLATHSEVPREISGLKRRGSYDLDVYESETAWPRAFFTDRIVNYGSLEWFRDRLLRGDGEPFLGLSDGDTRALNPATVSLLRVRGNSMQPATHYHLTANSTAFDVKATGPGAIFLSEGYYPLDFIATVNGAEVPYFRANFAFKAVAIPAAGNYHVVFRFRPHDWSLACGLFCAGLAILLLILATALFGKNGSRDASDSMRRGLSSQAS